MSKPFPRNQQAPGRDALAAALAAAEPFEPEPGPNGAKMLGPTDRRAHLVINKADLPATARELAKLLATDPFLFDHGGPAELVNDPLAGPTLVRLDVAKVTNAAHRVCQPAKRKLDPATNTITVVDITLPPRVASLYLGLHRDWALRPLRAIVGAPVMRPDGSLGPLEGYDADARVLVSGCPRFDVPARPTHAEAETGLRRIRALLRTFAFADAELAADGFVDLDRPPGLDESAAIAALVGAVLRGALDLAPALAIVAAALSGAGVGKGLLARTIFTVALGRPVGALTAGHDEHELEKRVTAALLDGRPALFLDNLNASTLASSALASVLTERPIRLRPFGRTETVTLDAAPIVIVTGNALTISEDLVRRFLACRMDPRCEHPEQRRFHNDPVADAQRQRADLLAAAFTIARWGAQQGDRLPRGLPLGSFGTWARRVRDPLIALGCRDPVERLAELKAADPRRRAVSELFAAWWAAHGRAPIRASELAEPARAILDPHNRGRQFLARRLAELVGIRVDGYVLTASRGSGPKAVATYALEPTELDPAARG